MDGVIDISATMEYWTRLDWIGIDISQIFGSGQIEILCHRLLGMRYLMPVVMVLVCEHVPATAGVGGLPRVTVIVVVHGDGTGDGLVELATGEEVEVSVYEQFPVQKTRIDLENTIVSRLARKSNCFVAITRMGSLTNENKKDSEHSSNTDIAGVEF